MENYRCFSVNFQCRRCKSLTTRGYHSNPREYPFCRTHTGDPKKNYLRCHGVRKDGLRCRLVFNMITRQDRRLFRTKERCLLHSSIQRETCWIVGLLDGITRGIFISLEKAEDFAEYLQKNYNKLITLNIDTGYRKEYYLYLSFYHLEGNL